MKMVKISTKMTERKDLSIGSLGKKKPTKYYSIQKGPTSHVYSKYTLSLIGILKKSSTIT